MADALIRQQIRKLVQEKNAISQRLQRRPPAPRLGVPLAASTSTTSPAAATTEEADASDQPVQSGEAEGDPSQQTRKRALTPNTSYDFAGPEFQVEKRPRVVTNESECKRHKRFFGVFTAHLQKAKQQLDKEQDTDRAQKHKLKEQQVLTKVQRARTNLAAIARQQWLEERKKNESELAKITAELVAKENDLMVSKGKRFHLVQHYTHMENFIGTETQPALFWRPAVWDENTRRLREQTKLWIQTKINHIRESDYTFKPADDAAETADGDEEPEAEEETERVEEEPKASSNLESHISNNQNAESEDEGREDFNGGGVDG